MFSLRDDLRLAVRRLQQRPGFTIVAILTLALGLGVNIAIFTLIRAAMFQTLPVDKPHELVRLGDDGNCCVNSGIQQRYSLFSVAAYQHLRGRLPALSSLTAFQANIRGLGLRRVGREVTDSLPAAFVASNYFSTLGVRPATGRLLTAEDDTPGADPVFVLSHRAWADRFSRDESVVGTAFVIGDRTMTLVGVAAEGFYGETLRPDPAAIWLPLGQEAEMRRAAALSPRAEMDWLYAIGRLAPGATVEDVQRQATVEIQRWLAAQSFLDEDDRRTARDTGVNVVPAPSGVTLLRFTYERPLTILFVMSGLVLLIAAANLANLLLARSDRSQAAIQTALGAPTGRLVRQSLTEGILLATTGGLAGMAIAWLATRYIVRIAFPGANYLPMNLAPDPTILGFTLGLAALTGALFSAAPAWAMARIRPMEALRSGRSNDQRSFVPRRSLVVLQVALSVILLAGAGLLTESLRRLQQQPLGFETNGRVVARIQMPDIAGDPARLASTYDAMVVRLRRIPGVRDATYSLYGPMSGDNWSSGISIEGLAPDPQRSNSSSWNRIGPAYFETTGTRVVRGRAIDERDTPGAQKVAVVNQSFVRRFFPDSDPLGRRLGIGGPARASDYEIVGVTEDVKYTGAQAPTRPMIFLPTMQLVDLGPDDSSTQSRSTLAGAVTLHVAPGTPTIEPLVKQAMAEIDPAITVLRFLTMSDQVSANFRISRLMASLTAAYGLLALALASLGLYGVTAYGVARRTREIGIRMALGADRSRVVRDVLAGAVIQTGLGLLVGLPAALLAVPAALAAAGTAGNPNVLYGINARDPGVLAVAVLVLIGSALCAAFIPARRAATIDPTRALRSD